MIPHTSSQSLMTACLGTKNFPASVLPWLTRGTQ